ncbi:armadillo-type protein [Mycena vulgaris]|nr:armadillo-type protein [Mycena vulgaris]
MAEVAVGLLGAAATVGAVQLATGSGFTGRHESRHREEMMETKRNTDEFRANLQSGDVTKDEEIEFLNTKDQAIRLGSEYHDSIESYKEVSWFNFSKKFKKKKDVRRWKRSTRQANHTLRSLNESMSSGSDTSSICASSGSPPGSNLAADEIQDWTYAVHGAVDVVAADAAATDVQIDSCGPTAFSRADSQGHVEHHYHRRAYAVHRDQGLELDPGEHNDDGDSLEGLGYMEAGDFDSDDSALLHSETGTSHSYSHEPTQVEILQIIQIIERLRHNDDTVRWLAVGAFGKLTEYAQFHRIMKPGIPDIVEMLRDGDRSIRRSAANALGKLADHPVFHDAMRPGIVEIIGMLENSDENVRYSAVNACGKMANQIAEMRDDSDRCVRDSDGKAFGNLADHSVFHDALKARIPRITDMLKDSDWDVRPSAAQIFGKWAENPVFHDALKAQIPQITEILEDTGF